MTRISVTCALIGVLLSGCGWRHEVAEYWPEADVGLRFVGLWLHEYKVATGTLPGNIASADGTRALLSWRVRLATFRGYDGVVDETRPWDSEANVELSKCAPRELRAGVRNSIAATRILRVESSNEELNGWGGGGGPMIVVEGRPVLCFAVTEEEAVPWTQPDDLTVNEALSALERNKVSHALLDDATVVEYPFDWQLFQ